MERRKALAFAAAVTCVLGSTTVAVAAVGGVSLLGFGGGHQAQAGSLVTTQQSALASARVITRTKDVYDRITIQAAVRSERTRSAAYLAPIAPPAVPTPGASTAPKVIKPRSAPAEQRRRRSSAPRPIPRSATRTPVPTTTTTEPDERPSPTTTVPPVTTTTRPRGVPKDWPPGKPIPPMPPNCGEPHLEDNGVWNCQDD